MSRAAAIACACLVAGLSAHTALASSWTGTYRLPAAAEPVAISVELAGRHAIVSLGPGHAGRTALTAQVSAGRIRFAFPGMPANVVFDGAVAERSVAGSVRQGALRGTFRLSPGRSRVLPALGLYRSAGGAGVAIVQAAGLPAWLVELPSGNIHGLGRGLTTVGARLGSTHGAGTLAVAGSNVTWRHGAVTTRYTRVQPRQREVRIGALAATLTTPAAAGHFAAVAMAHGSGPQTRAEFQVFAAYCELLGIAVLADDKRGIGQSQGTYPGERASAATIDVLARDLQSEARFLSTLAGVDQGRVGALGDSQAGWIIARAAAREQHIRWAVPLVGPTVTVDEADLWGSLAGQGQTAPAATRAQMTAQVRTAGKGGFDPLPSLQSLTIPVHWVFADDDRNVPTELCLERLQAISAGHAFSWSVIHATHTLLELPTGLNADLPRSRGFGSGLFASVGAWLRERGIA